MIVTALSLLALGHKPSGWTTYVNPRFGVSAELPTYLKAGPEPDNSDGLTFTGRGVTVLVYGQYRIQSKAECFHDAIDYWKTQGKVTYKLQGSNFFIVSGHTAHDVFYQRTLLGKAEASAKSQDDVNGTVIVQHPASEATAFDPTLRRITKSLKLG
jgi:hypothetical protein